MIFPYKNNFRGCIFKFVKAEIASTPKFSYRKFECFWMMIFYSIAPLKNLQYFYRICFCNSDRQLETN